MMKNGRWYKVSDTNAFTGSMRDYYSNGTVMTCSMIFNGLPNGEYKIIQ
jgi:antitoxin component YwqK of YwqJK toxin-antitoxin module